MIKESDDLLQPQCAFRGPLDDTEQGSELFLSGNERAERRPKQQLFASDYEAGFAPIRIG